MAIISLENMEFFAYHGCYREEQLTGTRFLVDLWIETDTTTAEYSDVLADTINYQDIYLLVKEEMEKRSKLLEHVGRRILNRIRSNYPQIRSARVKVAKINPPLGGKIGSVSLTLTTE